MFGDKDATFSLKAVINKQKNKVLFAEIESDLANVLLGFMTLPLGRIVQLLRNDYGDDTPSIGSLSTLYNGVANLDSSHFMSNDKRQRPLDPENTACSSPFQNKKFYGFVPNDCFLGEAFTGNFIEYSASFIASDDLGMMDNVSRSFVESLYYVKVATADLDGAETRIVAFGVKEIMDLLKGSFISRHPLTDIILGTKWMNSTPEKSETAGISLHDLVEDEAPYESLYKIYLNLMFEKSTKKFLFAQADQDFVYLLFSMLIIPLGVVECLCESVSGLNNIDNLHESITNMGGGVLCYGTHDWLYGDINHYKEESLFTSTEVRKQFFVGSRPRLYIVTDDLTVTPFSVCSTLSLLNQMKISPSDVQEVDFEIGYEEVKDLNILKASLTSTRAIADGFLNIILKRQERKKQTLIDASEKSN